MPPRLRLNSIEQSKKPQQMLWFFYARKVKGVWVNMGLRPIPHMGMGLFLLFLIHALQGIYKSQYCPDFTAGHLPDFSDQLSFFGGQFICG